MAPRAAVGAELPTGTMAQQTVLTAATRMQASLHTLNAGLRSRSLGSEVGFTVGSEGHAALLAALDELETVRQALLANGGAPPGSQ